MSSSISLKQLIRSAAAILILLAAASPLAAMDLGQAKASGLVGETHTGYLGAVKDNAEAAALVSDINAKRKQRYRSIASKNGISLDAVEARAGLKAIEKTPAGQYVNTGSGWQKK